MRSSHRNTAARPLNRRALAAALALAFGAFDAHALNQTVSGASGVSMSAAILAENADYATRAALDSTATCTGEEIVVDGTGGFVVAESAPLPALSCPGITIRGTGDGTYGGRISGAASFLYGGCGLNAGSLANIDSLEVDGFSNAPGLCGAFGSIVNSTLHGNGYGLQGSVKSFTGNKVYSNSLIGVDLHNTGSSIGGSSAAARNYIYGNGTGVAVEYGGSADIGFNYIGTADGVAAYGGNSTGVALYGNASSVHDNLISANSSTGIDVQDAGGSVIRGNTIGLDAGGTVALNNGQGILTYSSVTIDDNLISGNTYNIEMHGSGSVTSNLIGLDVSGTNPVGNGVNGVLSLGSTPPLVAGNQIAGVQYPIEFANAIGGTIQGNHIGLTSTGTPVASDAQYVGITLNCSSSVTINGSNIVGGMSSAGIGLYGSSGNTISGNFIGVANDGKTSLRNTGVGIQIGAGGCLARYAVGKRATGAPAIAARTLATGSNTIQSNVIASNLNSGIQIESGAASTNNQITNNTITANGGPATGSGVSIEDNASVGNTIVTNFIYGNAPKNINLNTVDPTAPLLNDAGDTDTGPNDGLNYPEITAVRQDGTSTSIDFNMNVPAGSGSYYVQFFANGSPAAGGQTLVGTTDVNAISGIQPLTVSFLGTFDNISATSTVVSPVAGTTAGDTSEFSPSAAATQLPALTVSPASFNFGAIEAGATSATSASFTLQSSGAAPWTLSTFTTKGACPATPAPLDCSGTSFVCSTDCVNGASVSPGSACTITASFAPQLVGASNLGITICDNTGKPQSVQLAGNGTLPPPVTISPSGVNFGNVVVGASSGAQTFTLANPAHLTVSLGAVSATAPFSVASTTCGATLAPVTSGAASTCTASVVFTPGAPGVSSGQLNASFTSSATGSPVTVPIGAALAGVGVAAVQLSLPPAVNVGTYAIGLAPITATAQVKNLGTTTVPISITASAPFSANSDCGGSVAAGGTCTITIALASTSVGPVSGTLTVLTGAGPQVIALTGLVAPPAISLVPAQVDFGQVLVNKSASRDIVATNTTGATVALGTPAVSGPFSIASNGCGPIVGANGTCTITVSFAPQRGGQASGALTLNFGVNASLPASLAASSPAKRTAKAATNGATAVASLTGSGIDAAALDMPTLLEFGTYIVGSAPIVRTATLTSSGTGVVTFQELSASGPFGLTSDCPLNLAPGQSCTLTITYSSSTLGAAAGLITIRSNAIGGLRTISLGALTQLKAVPIVDVKPTTISFGNRLIGTQSPAVTVTIANSGGAPATLGPLVVSSDYVIISTTCGTALAAQASCSASIAMSPIGFGPRPGSLSFTSNADGSPHSVGLGGTGCRPPGAGSNRGGATDSCAP